MLAISSVKVGNSRAGRFVNFDPVVGPTFAFNPVFESGRFRVGQVANFDTAISLTFAHNAVLQNGS